MADKGPEALARTSTDCAKLNRSLVAGIIMIEQSVVVDVNERCRQLIRVANQVLHPFRIHVPHQPGQATILPAAGERSLVYSD